MDKHINFEEYRKKYTEFCYNSYSVSEDSEAIYLNFEFEILNLTKFNPSIKILKKDFKVKNIDSNAAKNMAFNIGLIELISYWKCVCSPKVIIKCGFLNEEQIVFWKKIYFYGLGELFYRNNIKTNIDDFMKIECLGEKLEYEKIDEEYEGYIIPVGGGKDSAVTLENIKKITSKVNPIMINPKPTMLKCAEIGGYSRDKIIEIYRTIDTKLLRLNEEGYINGHTPFSAMLAFVSYFAAYVFNKKYIALSNESSANESNVNGEKINHQYSKSFEFECDFENYSDRYLKAPVKYFSLLRPLNELQIAKLFSKYEQYHKVFKSCNVGSKEKEWKWCCNCAKCLFAYIILSPYLYKQKLVNIFGEDLFEREDLQETFIELIGKGANKPFDCVGTFEEVNFAVSKTIENLNKENLPYLLKYYYEKYNLVDTKNDITLLYNNENNLTVEQNDILRKEVF